MKNFLLLLNRTLKAQGLMEYALIIIIVAILILAALYIFGDKVGRLYSAIIQVV